jgi:hypothetical protein
VTPTADERWQLADGYRIELFAEQRSITGADVVQMWTSAGVLDPAEAQRRLSEVLLVGIDDAGRVAGVGTVYVRHNEQLRAKLWHYRTFVAPAHRQSNLAAAMAVAARDHLSELFRAGQDRTAIGILFRVQSEILKRHVPQAIWPQTGFVFIGEDAHGAHLRVHWFPGVLAPEPSDQASE